ncbi:MAG TPA: hypothetical protein VF041_07875 [Gemmatimonadaceae bacterium]
MTLIAYANDSGGYALHLSDAEREAPVGWVEGRGVGFRGFDSQGDAARAAYVAYEAVARWLARERLLAEPWPDAADLDATADGPLLWLEASGVRVGRIVPPSEIDGEGTHAFELLLPPRVGGATGLNAALVIHRALRSRCATPAQGGPRWRCSAS